MTRIEIDLNVRVRGNLTYSGYEHADGPLSEGEPVTVYEPDSGLAGSGCIVELDDDSRIVYIAVDWTSLQPEARVVGAKFRAGAGMVVGGGVYNLAAGGVLRENLGTAPPVLPAAATDGAALSRA